MIQRTIQISNFLLVFAGVYFCVNFFYQFVEVKLEHSGNILPSVHSTPASVSNKKQSHLSAYRSITQRNLFKTAKKSNKEPVLSQADIDSLRQTDLNLKLWGTVSTDKEESNQARAVIEDTQAREQRLYKVGDSIQSAKIIKIFRNSVILDVNGRTEKLIIDEEIVASHKIPAIIEQKKTSQTPKEAVSLKRSQVNDALSNINEIMDQVRIEPVFKDGKPDGIMLANIEQSSILKTMGLRIGDIITGINGQKIDSVENALAFYQTLSSGEKLSLQLKRRGRPTTMDFVIE